MSALSNDGPETPTAFFTHEQKQALVQRIVRSSSFSKAGRLSSFLLHVCALESSGRSDEISEQRIGESIFGRSGNYDPSMDGIVRSHASRLRLRLEQYFQQEGADEPIRLSIPRGAYMPVFELRYLPEGPAEFPPPFEEVPRTAPAVETQPTPAVPLNPSKSSRRRLPATLGFCALLGLLFWLATLADPMLPRRLAVWLHPAPTDRLWQTLFVPGRETLFVVGDGGANMFENMATRQLTPDEYASRSWLKEPLAQTPPGFTWAPIAERTYTPWFAVDLGVQLARLPQVADRQLSVIGARDLRLDNLKNSQAILVGGPNYDPWEQLFADSQNFHMVYDAVANTISIVNTKPLSGEAASLTWSQTDRKSHHGYSLITLTHNLSGDGRVLMLQGTTAQGDKAAGEFLFDAAQMDPILRRAILPDGRLRDFEIVLESKFVAGGNMDSRPVMVRIR